MELRKNWRKLTTALSRFWHREAGPMNWKNPVRVVAYIGWEIFNGVAFWVGEWVRYGVRAGQIFLAIPPPRFSFSAGGGSPFGALSGVLFRRLRRSHCSIFWSITTQISTVPLWFGTTFRRWWR